MTQAFRNLVLCFDGTGNVWKPGPNETNVVKLVRALGGDPQQQLYYYDPGVGTPDGVVSEGLAWRDLIARVSGLVWGGGVWRNVAAGYAFLMRQYRDGDRVFLFGFSRGAFTARAVAGLVDMFGLLRGEHENMIPTLISVYKSSHGEKDRKKRQREKASRQDDSAGAHDDEASQGTGAADDEARDSRNRGDTIRAQFAKFPDMDIHFIGVWDTVESVGLRQLLLDTNITTSAVVKPSYRHVRHAVALDERRWPYEPRWFYPRSFKYQETDTFLQAGFPGAHSDVGGGYGESGLANEALHWIAREAFAYGLLLDLDKLDRHVGDPWDLAHDEPAAQPAWFVAGAFDRDLPPTMFLHESALLRACAKIGAPVPPVSERGQRVVHTRRNLTPPGASAPIRRELPRAAPGTPRQVRPRAWQWIWLVAFALLIAWLAARHRELEFELAKISCSVSSANSAHASRNLRARRRSGSCACCALIP